METVFATGWRHDLEAAAKANWTDRPPIVQSSAFDDVDISDPGFTLANEVKFWQNQGPVGSCFADAVTNSVEISISGAVTLGANIDEIQLSRAWVWYQGRKLDNMLGSGYDGGSVTNAMRAVCNGIPPEKLWPYKPNHSWLERKPSQEAVDAAGLHKLKATVPLEFGDRDGIKKTIKSRLVPVIGIIWPTSWDYQFSKDGIVTSVNGIGNAGHALCVIGWKIKGGRLYWHILNSHGAIYPGASEEFLEGCTGYTNCPTPGKTYAFWCPDEYFQYVGSYNNRELVAPIAVIAPSNRKRLSWLEAGH